MCIWETHHQMCNCQLMLPPPHCPLPTCTSKSFAPFEPHMWMNKMSNWFVPVDDDWRMNSFLPINDMRSLSNNNDKLCNPRLCCCHVCLWHNKSHLIQLALSSCLAKNICSTADRTLTMPMCLSLTQEHPNPNQFHPARMWRRLCMASCLQLACMIIWPQLSAHDRLRWTMCDPFWMVHHPPWITNTEANCNQN